MRKITIYTCRLLLGLGLLTACDSGFDELNTSKTRATALNPLFELNNAIVRTSFPGNTLVYEEAIVQQMVTPNSGVLTGGNFNQDNRPVTQGMWQRYYRDVIKHTVDVIDKTADDPNRTNLYHMARIWQAYAMMLLTDSYGDVPYAEAGLGYLEATVSPKYTAQQEIYANILQELEEASAGLSAAAVVEAGDVMYSGRVDRWKRLGYSLMLRAAMRLTRVDPGTAQSYV
ncbi:MAG TPA: SusD/RagB family nutrient-binding outer membrane lipoprotein, partial [Cytophagales bacterium]